MLLTYTSPLALGFAVFRLALFLVTLLAGLWLWRRPRAGTGLFLLLVIHLACWAAYTWPLQRPYALDEGSDRSFNTGMAACVAAGRSPLQHTQIRFQSPEPFWNLAAAALALFRPERAASAYGLLAPFSIVAVALGLFFGLRGPAADDDAWERLLLVFSVLNLASLSMSPDPPIPAFWMGNFLLKPNHATAFGLIGVALGLAASKPARFKSLGVVLGLLAWVFLVSWAYVVFALLVYALLYREGRATRLRNVILAAALSALFALPYVLHLTGGYNPLAKHQASTHMWGDALGVPLAIPNWSTLDLGLLFVLGVIGMSVLWRSPRPLHRVLLGVVLGAWLLWLVSIPATLAGIAPEPDELHYFLRFMMALGAGAALAAGARHVEAAWTLAAGRGHLLVMAACLPLSFPFYWDPPSMDRYYPMSRTPLRPKVVAYTDWIREHVGTDAVFAGGRSSSAWIPALTGRAVLLAEAGRLLPPDYTERKAAERILLTSSDPALVVATARRYGVTYLAIDPALREEYGEDLAHTPAHRTRLQSSAVRLVEIVEPEKP
jgi:hypothetical protein